MAALAVAMVPQPDWPPETDRVRSSLVENVRSAPALRTVWPSESMRIAVPYASSSWPAFTLVMSPFQAPDV